MMLYVVNAEPYEGAIAKARSAFNEFAALTLELVDAEGFSISPEITLKLGASSRVVDKDGKPTHVQWSGSQSMSVEAYASARMLIVGWRGFPPVAKE